MYNQRVFIPVNSIICTEAAMVTIKERLHNLINISDLEEVKKVTGKVVKQTCGMIKPGNVDVTEVMFS